jgi:SprT protein
MTDTPNTFFLTNEQINLIKDTSNRFITLANTRFSLKLQPLPIRFDVYGSAWGYFVRKHDQRWFRYNPMLFARHLDEGLNDTIPHEVAHYVVDHRFPRKRCKPHGAEWRQVMQVFGIENPRATHTTSLEGLVIRRQRRYIYYCGCGETALSATRHNRIIFKGVRYICNRCRQPLTAEKPG